MGSLTPHIVAAPVKLDEPAYIKRLMADLAEHKRAIAETSDRLERVMAELGGEGA
jgi:hypothetical protein